MINDYSGNPIKNSSDKSRTNSVGAANHREIKKIEINIGEKLKQNGTKRATLRPNKGYACRNFLYFF